MCCDAATPRFSVKGAAKSLALSTCSTYDAAPETSLQSKLTGCDTASLASLAGLSSDGAARTPGVGTVVGVTVNVVICVTLVLPVPPSVADSVATVSAETAAVETANWADVEPGGTMTEAGTAAALLLLERLTTVPDASAAPLRVTVAVLLEPPVTLAGATAIDVNDGEPAVARMNSCDTSTDDEGSAVMLT